MSRPAVKKGQRDAHRPRRLTCNRRWRQRTLTGALHLSDPSEAGEWPVRVFGISASVDNDVALTILSIGVDTAMNTVADACDKVADTVTADDGVFIVEAMGREWGYLAMTSAVASGVGLVLFPEADRTETQLVDSVIDAVLAESGLGGAQKVIAIKAEGIETRSDRLKELIDEQLQRRTGRDLNDIETRVTVLGHVARGGWPSVFDRLPVSEVGNVAVRSLVDGAHRKMVA
jgi:6-phosphofructokinase 1